MDNNTREMARKDYENGIPPVEIAAKYGLKPDTVRKWTNRYWKQDTRQDKARDKKTGQRDRTKKTPVTTAAQVDKLLAEAVEKNTDLTAKQKDFCRFFAKNKNATQAYLKAYGCSYNVANAEGYKLLVNPCVKAELRRLREIRDAALDISGNDVVEMHMRIAFADMTDFVDFENKSVPMLSKQGNPILTFDPETGDAKELHRNVNEVRLKNSNMVDGNIITEVSEGREGVKIKLADRQKSLAFLERYFELNPMDAHRKKYDDTVLALKNKEYEDKRGTLESAAQYSGLPANVIGKSYHEINLDIDERNFTRFDFKGGRGGGRSSFCSLKLIDQIMLNPTFCGLVVRAVKDTMRDSVYAQVVWAIEKLNLEHVFKCTVSPMQIMRKDTGQIIYFRGADEPGKIKSIKPPQNMHIAIVWAEEKDQIPGGASWRNILQSAFRGGDVAIELNSYNVPISQQHYLNKEILIPDPARTIHHGYYYDMPRRWLGDAFFEQAEHLKSTNDRAYRHEYLGEATGTGANVFENVKTRQISDSEIQSFDKCYFGLDFGYFPDPAAFNAYYYNAAKRALYIFDEVRALKCGNKELADKLRKYENERIIADSSEPKSIEELRRGHGLRRIEGARKGQGSVEHGMKWLASLNAIIIDPVRCPGAAEEFTAYEYLRSKDDEIISGYPDKNNHHIDNARYAMEEMAKTKGGFVTMRR